MVFIDQSKDYASIKMILWEGFQHKEAETASRGLLKSENTVVQIDAYKNHADP